MRDQFLVEVADTSAAELTEQQLTPAGALLELNALFSAWVESVYHHQVHSETQQTTLARWNDGWDRAGHGPIMASADALTEAFLWSALRTVTKTATVSLHGNTYQVKAALAGRKVELVFSPFNGPSGLNRAQAQKLTAKTDDRHGQLEAARGQATSGLLSPTTLAIDDAGAQGPIPRQAGPSTLIDGWLPV